MELWEWVWLVDTITASIRGTEFTLEDLLYFLDFLLAKDTSFLSNVSFDNLCALGFARFLMWLVKVIDFIIDVKWEPHILTANSEHSLLTVK